MTNFQFNHEKTKKERGIEAHISTPSDLAQLLTQLLEVDKAEGKIIYDCCFGTGALSQFVNTDKNILLGDDKELTYLEQGQKNIFSFLKRKNWKTFRSNFWREIKKLLTTRNHSEKEPRTNPTSWKSSSPTNVRIFNPSRTTKEKAN